MSGPRRQWEGPLGVGGGPSTSAPSGWTPTNASPFAWVDFGVDYAAFQTQVSGAFSQATDIAGSGAALVQATSGKRPAYDGTTTLNGHGCAHFTAGAPSSLATATGGVTGRGAHTQVVVASMDSVTGTDLACSLMGQTDAGFVGKCGTIGANGGTQSTHWWASRSGGSVVVGGTQDTAPHIFVKTYDGTNVSLYVDGILVAGPTADTGYALATGFGFGPWNASFPAAFRAYSGVWLPGAVSAAVRGQLEGFLATRFGRMLQIADGDSMTAPGYLVTVAQGWAHILAAPGGVTVAGYAQPNIAVVGRTLATCLANQPTAINVNISASGKVPSWVWLWAGTNDINGADNSAAATYANLATYVANCHAIGQRVGVVAIPVATHADASGRNTWYPAQRTALNALILANTAGADIVVTAPATDARLQTAGDGTYSITGNSPHYTAAGQAIVAAEAQAKLQALYPSLR